MLQRLIPKSGEAIPVIGLGTWQTFDVTSAAVKQRLRDVLQRFTAAGARLLDTSPMYGRAEEVAGELAPPEVWMATKVWTRGERAGIEQMETSMRLLRRERLDLIQIHNLVDWRTHLATLRRWKEEGRVRYIGITHYTTGSFRELADIMAAEELDFVQLPLSVALPDAEKRLLPLAHDRGIAVIVNRPFEGGTLARDLRRKPLPSWAHDDYGAASWSELLLRWIVSHPAVTCVIPATGNPEHMSENLRAGEGRILTMEEREELRRRVNAEA